VDEHGVAEVRLQDERVERGGSADWLVLVLSYTRHWLGERSPLGRAAALLAGYPPSHYRNNGPAVRCRSSPEFPFRFIWVLGWSTWYLWPIKS
jgi:hypothetical protein